MTDADEWARRGSSFGSVAASYAEHRPGYPVAAVRWCVAPAGRDIGSLRVLDLLSTSDDARDRLRRNTELFRAEMTAAVA